jgi:excisionase family DNA binding protein
MDKAFFSTPELAELLGVFHTTIRRWIERDQIKGFRVGRNYKIPAAEVLRMLKEHGLALPERPGLHASKDKGGNVSLATQENTSGSVLQKLLVVDETNAPALVCRNNTILGANQLLADLVGLTQVDLIGLRLSDVVISSGNGDIALGAQSGPVDPGRRSHACTGLLKTNAGTQKKVSVTIEGMEEMRDVFLLVVGTA